MSLHFPSRCNSPSPLLPLLYSLCLAHFLSISPSLLILPLAVRRMRGFSPAVSRSGFFFFFSFNRRHLFADVTRLAATQPWAPENTMQVRILPSSPPSFIRGYVGSRCCFGRAAVCFACLFVYHHLSSAVTPPGPSLRFLRSGPLWQWLFWPRRRTTAAVLTPRPHVHARSSRDLWPCIEFSMNCCCMFVNRERMRPPVGLHGFFSADTPEHWPWQFAGKAGNPIDHFSHGKTANVLPLPFPSPPVSPHPTTSQHLRAAATDSRATLGP